MIRPGAAALVRFGRAAAGGSAALAVATANVLLLFRHSVLGGFAQISADPWDGRLILAIHEHWYRVWSLQAHWRRPAFFHPSPDALGYTDAFFLHGVIFSLCRALGLDQYAAFELVSIAFKLIGFFGFYGLARRILRVRRSRALLGATVFFQLNASAIQLGHSQLLVLNLFPTLIELGVAFGRAAVADRRWRTLLLGHAIVAIGAASLMSGLYMSWYLALYGCTAAILVVLLAPAEAARVGGMALSIARRMRWQAIALAVWAILLALPAVATYLPTATETGMHNVAVLHDYAGTPIDIVNLGPGNRLWSKPLDAALLLLGDRHFGEGERTSGVTPTLLVLGSFAAAWLWRRPQPARSFVRALLLGAAILWLASVQIGGFLGWEYIFEYVPFGRATRAAPRIQLFFQLFLVLAVTQWLDRARWFGPPLRFAGLALLLVLEQFNTWYGWGMRREVENRLLVDLAPPPAGCRSFFVSRAMQRPGMSQQIRDDYAANTDAMVVAERFGLPTLNGISAFAPRGWDLNRPDAPDYRDRVLRYAREHGVTDGLCALDAEASRWELVSG